MTRKPAATITQAYRWIAALAFPKGPSRTLLLGVDNQSPQSSLRPVTVATTLKAECFEYSRLGWKGKVQKEAGDCSFLTITDRAQRDNGRQRNTSNTPLQPSAAVVPNSSARAPIGSVATMLIEKVSM